MLLLLVYIALMQGKVGTPFNIIAIDTTSR